MRADIVAGVLVLVAWAVRAEEAMDLYVSPSGNDAWTGRSSEPNADRTDGPFATLERARDELRRLSSEGARPRGGVTVHLRGGLYALARSFELGQADSGSPGSPVVYRAFRGEEVRISGGREVPASAFGPASDPEALRRLGPSARGKVLAADLKALGIASFGELAPRGFGRPDRPAALELFFRDMPMTLARWPNQGWARIASEPAPAADRFAFEGDRPLRWASAEGVWLHGYWTWDWADSYVEVQAVDAERRQIVTKPPHGVYGYKPGKRFRALNVLEELDEPGEWYLDRRSGVLYFWPPAPLGEGRVFVSILEKPIVSVRNASHIVLKDLVIECARGDGVSVEGGSDVLVSGCTLRNIGGTAAVVNGGRRHGIAGCDIYYIGEAGISLSGGDRKTLEPGGHFAANNHIHDYSIWCRTYRPAVGVNGVGHRVANNLIHDAPHNAILLGGNEHVIELNEIFRVCRETGDAGAFYMGRDWTARGNVIRYNFFHDLEGVRGESGFTEVMAVYLDDAASGARVYGNVSWKVARAVMVGGGRDNIVENNLFVDCPVAIHVDARGIGWARRHIDIQTGDWQMMKKLQAVNWREPPYSTRYPELARILDDEPYFPKGTVIARNVAWRCGKWLLLLDGLTEEKLSVRDNLAGVDPGFADPSRMDFRPRPGSAALKIGFEPIPMDKIGLRRDEHRRVLPKLARRFEWTPPR